MPLQPTPSRPFRYVLYVQPDSSPADSLQLPPAPAPLPPRSPCPTDRPDSFPHPTPPRPRKARPSLIGQLFRNHGPDYLERHIVTSAQRRVVRNISACRTQALGGNRRTCPECGYSEIHYNSCCDRHCPICQATDRLKWIAKRATVVLPVGHFFVTFTLPDQLRPIAFQNQALVYNLMFRAVARTLDELSRDCLHARLGFTAVLHTWTREILYHPHIHALVTAGGLTDDNTWVSTRPNFLFPFARMKALFRKHVLQGLYRLYRKGKLRFLGAHAQLAHPKAFARRVKKLWRIKWVVDVQSPRGRPEHAIKYLATYTRSVAISDYRILSIADGQVRFKTRGDNTLSLHYDEFFRRFLLHVLPSGFHKVRHYGLYSKRAQLELETARKLLSPPTIADPSVDDRPVLTLATAERWEDIVMLITGLDPLCCPLCNHRGMVLDTVDPPERHAAPRALANSS